MKYIILILSLVISSVASADISTYVKSLKTFAQLCNSPSSVSVKLRYKTDLDVLARLKYETTDALLFMLEEIDNQSRATINVFEYNLDSLIADHNTACISELNKFKKDAHTIVRGSGFNNYNVSMDQYFYIVKIDKVDYVVDLSLYYF